MDLCERGTAIWASSSSPMDLLAFTGVHPGTPDGSSGQDEIQKLEQLERDAKQKKLGAWAISGQPVEWPSATPQPLVDTSQPKSATPGSFDCERQPN